MSPVASVVLGVLGVLALLVPAAPAISQPAASETAFVPVERAYGEVLRAAAAGSGRAPHQLLALQQAVVDLRAGFPVDDRNVGDFPRLDEDTVVVPGNGCLEKVEGVLLGELFEAEPRALLTVHELYLGAYVTAIRPPYRRWLAQRAMQTLDWLLDRHRERFGRGGRPERTLLLLAQADELQGSGFVTEIEAARERFDDALKLGTHRRAALYWRGVLSELLAEEEEAVEAFAQLARLDAADPEVTLRLAVSRARLGKKGAASKGLAAVARGEAPEWMRIVAIQELVRLERGDPAPARRLLEEAVSLFPAEPRLALQMAALDAGSERRSADWPAFDAAVERAMEASLRDRGPSPRFRYDIFRRAELDAARRELHTASVAAREAMASALQGLEAEVTEEPSVESCPGLPVRMKRSTGAE